jgi:4-hydroxy-tetrahydrodipicolinate synthase
MPLKYCLWKQGLLRSPECRLPLTSVSEPMAAALDDLVAELPAL